MAFQGDCGDTGKIKCIFLVLEYKNGEFQEISEKKEKNKKNTLSLVVKYVIIFTATFQRVFESQTNTIFRRN